MTRARAAWLLLGVFLLGAAGGAFGTAAFLMHRVRHGGLSAERVDEMVTRRLTRRLHLDAQQEKALGGIVTRAHQRLDVVRDEVRPRIHAILDQACDELRPSLRPDQIDELGRVRAEVETRLERRSPR